MAMLPERWVGEGLAGRYAYNMTEHGMSFGTSFLENYFRHGDIWLDAQGAVYASADCVEDVEYLPGRMEALVPAIEYDLLIAHDTHWPIQ
jgi:hypothetical protein